MWRSLPETRRMVEQVIQEVVAVGPASHIEMAEDAIGTAMGVLDRLPPNARASKQRDLMEGCPSELEYQNGALVRCGRETGVNTPVIALM